MPKYNDFELDLTTTNLNEEYGSVASMDVTVIIRHNSCAGHCGTSVSSAGFMKCVGTRTTIYA